MKRIWLNHWFSTAYYIINMIRRENPDVQMIGSNENLLSPIKNACDEWYQEPVLTGKDYVDFCLEFCQQHDVNVFLPRREMVTISRYKQLFTEYGVRVMVDDYELVAPLNDKAESYRCFSEKRIGIVPEFRVVETADEFSKAYDSLLADYEKVCIKFVHDEGGKSYRLIDNKRTGYSALFKKLTTRMTYDAVYNALSEKESFPPLMVMPYLPDEEVSVDCLNTAAGLIAIPRVKDYSRIERIEYDPEILDTCKAVLRAFPLECPCNIQFKTLNGVRYLLEVNTRMSGGIHMACEATGVNIPDIAVNKLMGNQKSWNLERKPCSVSHVEMPVVL